MAKIKLLMCITMLFIFACDSSDGGNTATLDDLQGTWDITNTCLSGEYANYGYDYENNEEVFLGCETIPSGYCIDTEEEYGFRQWMIVEGDQATACNDEIGSTECDDDPDTIILSGNTLTVISYDGDSQSFNINLSSDGGMVTLVSTQVEESCSITVTSTWTKQ